MEIKIIKDSISIRELADMASKEFGDLVKAVVDSEQAIMAVGGELHSDEETLLIDGHSSKRQNVWGVNLYPAKFPSEDWIEFNSMINIKPQYGNSSRGIENEGVTKKVREVVKKLTRK